ncbi:MAG: hypothetical protein F6K53_20350 [Moorea sp. SIO4A1]|uniref:hypothetical protein n=1 Tax=Moorena sp. SIO4A1 TaxID=2607835 RepID=UPI00144C1759|nr:hypothetical protein [Moorena sp. SIO4A1]NEQ59624.1 hypothetical protein [Moorena sp. SIO4A1]
MLSKDASLANKRSVRAGQEYYTPIEGPLESRNSYLLDDEWETVEAIVKKMGLSLAVGEITTLKVDLAQISHKLSGCRKIYQHQSLYLDTAQVRSAIKKAVKSKKNLGYTPGKFTGYNWERKGMPRW